MIKNILTQFGSLASLFGLIFWISDKDNGLTELQWALIGLSVILFIISIALIIQEYRKNSAKTFKDKKDIRNYMYKWIKSGNRVVIFTRDMSWVSDQDMVDLLLNKSRKDECIICLPKRISKVNQFEKAGATIIEYEKLNYTPLSRFTIINYGRDDAKVAVGKAHKIDQHIIEEYGNGEHPYFQVANDLVNILTNHRNG